MNKGSWIFTTLIIIALLTIGFGSRFFVMVPAGHVGVATLFGEVQNKAFEEGLHFPANPMFNWHFFDTRQKTLMETASVPSQDQLLTQIDVNVQYRIEGHKAPQILKRTGTIADAVNVHLTPTLRSQLREQGKRIKRAEDFFLETTQERIQNNLETELQTYLQPKGIEIQAVLLRDIQLPPFIKKAIESKKEREQEVEKQKAELERFRTEQQQKVAAAQAEREAAQENVAKRRLIADAQAYEIEKLNEAIAQNSAYLQLKALDALKSISENPASQIYFINGDSPSPLPLMHIGEKLIKS